ncbi:MAG: MFS transporter [Christensenellales bacterium]
MGLAFAMGVAVVGVVVYSFSDAYKASGSYAIMPYLFRREQYARVSGLSGMFGDAAAALISLTASVMLRGGASYAPLFSVSLVLMLTSALLYARMRPAIPKPSATEEKTGGRQVLVKINTPAYRKIMLPHFFRGIATAAMYYFVLTGHRNVPLNDAQSTFLITASVLTNMTGCFVFIRAVRRIRSGVLVVIAYSVCAAGMLTVPWVRTVGAFFALYIIYMIALVITQYSIPYGVLRSTKNEDLALISASRMFIHNVAAALFIFLFGIIMNRVSPVLVMACGAAAGLAAGVLYMAQFHDELR